MASSTRSAFIRPVTPKDTPALSKICLLTADAGISAALNHSENPGHEFPGNVYAVPYAVLKNTFGFVLVVKDTTESGEEEVVGYTLGATDTRAFEAEAERDWYPNLRERFPLSLSQDPGADSIESNLTAEDKRYIGLFHKPDSAYEACIEFSPAHLHIDILPEFQRQGWGRKLIDTAIRYLYKEGKTADGTKLEGVWLGMDPRNKEAAAFYERIGFTHVEEAPESYVGIKFVHWIKRYGD